MSLAAVVPSAGIAAEPDSTQEGGSAPEQAPDFESDSPNFDPGGGNDPTVEVGPPPAPDASPDNGSVESEPADDPDARLAPLTPPETRSPSLPETAPVAPPQGVPPATPPVPGFSIEPPPSAAPETGPASPPAPQSLGAEPGSRPDPPERLRAVVWVAPPPQTASPGPGSGVSADQAAPQEVTTANAGTTPVSGHTGRVEADRGTHGARFHIIQPGESLWTIAQELLGADASAMSVAAEVARLWELNRDRISSGDPDLIAVGERLQLR